MRSATDSFWPRSATSSEAAVRSPGDALPVPDAGRAYQAQQLLGPAVVLRPAIREKAGYGELKRDWCRRGSGDGRRRYLDTRGLALITGATLGLWWASRHQAHAAPCGNSEAFSESRSAPLFSPPLAATQLQLAVDGPSPPRLKRAIHAVPRATAFRRAPGGGETARSAAWEGVEPSGTSLRILPVQAVVHLLGRVHARWEDQVRGGLSSKTP